MTHRCAPNGGCRIGYRQLVRLEVVSDPVRFQELALPTLCADPVRHIAVLSWIRWRTGVAGTDPMLIGYDGDAVAGAVLVIGGEAYLGDLHEDLVEPVTRKLAELVPELAAVEATPAVVEAFGRHWLNLRSTAGRKTVAKRLQQLGTLVPPPLPAPPGSARSIRRRNTVAAATPEPSPATCHS